jgi:hypothetical protein
MKDISWFSLEQRSERIQSFGFLFPLCFFLIVASIFPLVYGMAEEKFLFVLFSGIIEVGSWIVLIVYIRKTCQLSDELLEDGERFLIRCEPKTDCLNKGSSWLAFQKFLKRCGI